MVSRPQSNLTVGLSFRRLLLVLMSGVCLAIAGAVFEEPAVAETPPPRGRVRSRPLKPLKPAVPKAPAPSPAPQEPGAAPSAEQAQAPAAQPTPSTASVAPTPVPEKRLEGTVEGSLVFTSGNSNTKNLGAAAEVNYRPTPWEYLGRMRYISHSDQANLTAESFTSEVRGGRELSPRRDVFVDVYYLANRFSGFDHQVTPELGTGYEWILADPMQLRTETAVGYNFEDRTDGSFNNHLIGRLGLLFGWALSETSDIHHETSFLPAFRNLDDWRMRSETWLTAGITTSLALKITHRYEYNNAPVEGKTPEDTSTMASFVAKF